MNDPSIGPTHGRRKCVGHRTNGEPCGRWPRKGAKVCDSHGAAAPQVRAMAAVRAELDRWGLGDKTVDPAETLLKLLSQSMARVEMYAAELEALVEQHGGDVQAAMVGDSMIVTRDGQTMKAGEYVRGLAKLEADERDRCANFAAKAVAAGLGERLVRLAEEQVAIVLGAIDAALDAAGIPAGARGPAKIAAARHLRVAGDPEVTA